MKIKYERKKMEDFVMRFAQAVTESNAAAKEAMDSMVDYMKTNNEDSKQKCAELWTKSFDAMSNLFEDDREKVMLVDLLDEIGVKY